MISIELQEQLAHNNVVVFCGAGISVSSGGLPSTNSVASALNARMTPPTASHTPFSQVTRAYETKHGRQALLSFIDSLVNQPYFQPLPAHTLIAEKFYGPIITTNWDDLIEKAFAAKGRALVKVVRDSDLTFVNTSSSVLIKLHGSIEQKDMMVVTDRDYYDVFANRPAIMALLKPMLLTRTLLFLGFGLEDEDFKSIYFDVSRNVGRHQRRAFAVQLNPSAGSVAYWARENIEIINSDAASFLVALP